MRSLMLSVVLLLCSFSAFSQSEDPVIIKVEDEVVRLSEFMTVYNKNRDKEELNKEDLLKYLDLYLNFKLKVHEAKVLGLDTAKSFRRELEGYRAQLAKPYMIDSKVTDKLLTEAYERLKSEVRASHILVKLSNSATPKDTLEAYSQAMKIRKQALAKGADFNTIAKEYSDDPSVTKNGGDLGYFTALYMVYPFENAAFNMDIGEVSMPVRTRFGYHIIKVTDKRPNQGEVKVAHIMIKPGVAKTEEDIAVAKGKAEEIYQKIMAGADFREMAAAHSQDKSTARNGGVLPMFGSNVMVEEFEKASFALSDVGEISKPVKTEYGFHIIKLLDRKGLQDFETMEYELKKKVEKDSRAELSKLSFINRLKAEYKFKRYDSRLAAVENLLDDSFYKGEWKVPANAKLNQTIFKFADQVYTQMDFAKFVEKKQIRTSLRQDPTLAVDKLLDQYIEQEILAYENSQLENKYPRFKSLMKEYYEGILLFELSDQKIWSRASSDTAGLQEFYETVKGKFLWPDRMKAVIVKTASEKIAKKAKKYLSKGKSLSWISSKLNKKSSLNFAYEEGIYAKEDHPIINTMDWSSEFSSIKEMDTQFVFVQNREVVPSGPKELKSVRGIVVSEYQGVLEKQWIEELREKYSWEVYPEVIETVVK